MKKLTMNFTLKKNENLIADFEGDEIMYICYEDKHGIIDDVETDKELLSFLNRIYKIGVSDGEKSKQKELREVLGIK